MELVFLVAAASLHTHSLFHVDPRTPVVTTLGALPVTAGAGALPGWISPETCSALILGPWGQIILRGVRGAVLCTVAESLAPTY